MLRTRSLLLAAVGACGLFSLGCEPDAPVRPGSAPQTSRLGVSKDGKTLFIALADHDEVRAVDAATGATLQTVSVVGSPHRLTVLADGTVAVTARYAGTVSVLDMNAGTTLSTTEVGSDPFGVVEVDGALYVAVAGEGDLAVVRDGAVVRRIVLEHDDPRGLALTGGKLAVSHFSAGRLSIVDVDSDAVVDDVDMRLPSRRFFTPNQMDQLTVDPQSPSVVVSPHVECNNDPAQFSTGSTDLVGVPAVQYYNNGPTGFPAVVPGVSRGDVNVGVIVSDDSNDDVQSGIVSEPTGPAPAIINPLNRTLLADTLVNAPTAVALADDGALELIVALGSGNVVVRRAQIESGQDSIVAVVDVGVGAEAIALSPDGATAYVWNSFAQTLTSFAVPSEAERATRFGGSGNARSPDPFTGLITRAAPIETLEAKTFTIAAQALPDNVVRGRTLFHSVDARLTQNGAISCASCHPGGGDDGTTWAFAEGPRQSPALWGGLLGTEPFHWDQAVRDIADISRVTIVGRMGGSGLGTSDMNAIGAWLDQIPAPAARVTTTAPNESVAHGAELFTGLGCTECHSGADFTDNAAYDVGTGRTRTVRETMDAFATPPLKGLAHTAPYLHDGSARSLREVVEKLVVTNDMVGEGVDASGLSDADIDDLTAFLQGL
jgi:cytochrome c553